MTNNGMATWNETFNMVGTNNGMTFTANSDIVTDTTGLTTTLATNNALPGYPQTLALSTTSQAYEKGDPTLWGQIDERGLTRQQNKVSIGAEDPDAQ